MSLGQIFFYGLIDLWGKLFRFRVGGICQLELSGDWSFSELFFLTETDTTPLFQLYVLINVLISLFRLKFIKT